MANIALVVRAVDTDMSEEHTEYSYKEQGEEGTVDINDEDKEMVTKVFNKFDADGSGAVSISELGNIMRSIGCILSSFSTFAVGNKLFGLPVLTWALRFWSECR